MLSFSWSFFAIIRLERHLNNIVYALQARGNAVFLFPHSRGDFFRTCRKLSSFIFSVVVACLPCESLFVRLWYPTWIFSHYLTMSVKLRYLRLFSWLRTNICWTFINFSFCLETSSKHICSTRRRKSCTELTLHTVRFKFTTFPSSSHVGFCLVWSCKY